MLRKLSVKNFRLLRDVTIDVEPGKPIVLIGPNGSGKSSVIQVLDLLSRWAEEGFVAGCRAFGGVESLVTTGQDSATIDLVTTTLSRWSHLDLHYSAELPLGFLASFKECLEKRKKPADEFVTVLERQDSDLWLMNDKTNQRDQLSVPAAVLSFEKFKQPTFYPVLDDLTRTIGTIDVYDGFLTTPLWTRDLREGKLSPFDSMTLEPVARISRRGLDLTNALYYIQQNHVEVWDELMDSFRAEFPFIQRLEFPADRAGGSVALTFRDKRYPGERLRGSQMSEGMATYLCLLAAILSPEPATALAFDEPDRHLHPSALRRIAYLLERASERTAVFVATHSDRFLDYLSDPAGSIRICEPTAEGVKLRMLNREALDEWRTLYSLSALRERGQLDPENSAEIDP
ncbi:AAA family ATPase [Polyangium fumosum]|uniref:ATP-binding cassette domain-containing protein n=1 Tax=Polyangium fumosum TaxID=889272 RepID=A0A4U1IWC6_9BACT|nr:AAA family ATPase [Polyangium fumosum]TKC98854.1 ATP-binding cassette domain-containing protein [Polyangium fumosum]